MIEDRRKYPRYPVLIRCTLVTPRDRRDAVCTQIGPASAFLTGRLEQLVAGEIVRVEMRSGGLGTPIITLLGLVLRVDLPAAGNPGGLVVRWRAATCELGSGPLTQFLMHVLRLPNAPEVDLNTDRHAQFDLEASLVGHHVQIVSPRPQAFHRVGSEAVRASAARSATYVAVARSQAADKSGQRPVIAPRREFGLLDDPGLRAAAGSAQSQPFAAQAVAQRPAPVQLIPQPVIDGAALQQPAQDATAQAQPVDPQGQAFAVLPPVPPILRIPADIQPPGLPQGGAHGSSAAASALTPLHTALRPSRSTIPVASVDQSAEGAGGLGTGAARAEGVDGAQGPILSANRRSSSALAVVLPPVDRSAKPRGERTPGLGWRPPVIGARGPDDPLSPETSQSVGDERLSAPGTGRHPLDRSALFDLAPEVSQAVGGTSDGTSSNRHRLATVSFPVYALAPAERRIDTNPDKELPRLATENFDMSGEPTDVAREVAVPIGDPPRPVANVADALRRRATSGNFDSQMMLHANFPVRFTVGSQLRSGHLVSLGAQAVAVITHEGAPELDQKVTVFLPVEMPEGPMVLDLRGKLLQVVTQTEAGPRFVMHIEKVEEGHHKGAFHRLLRSLAGR